MKQQNEVQTWRITQRSFLGVGRQVIIATNEEPNGWDVKPNGTVTIPPDLSIDEIGQFEVEMGGDVQ